MIEYEKEYNKVFKELMKKPKEDLVDRIMRLIEENQRLQEINSRRFQNSMLRKKSVGGVTIDR